MARLIVLCKIQPSLTLRIYFFFYSFDITGSEDCLLENGLLDWVLLFDSTFCAKVSEFKIYILLKMSSAPHLPRFPKDLSGLKTRSLTNFNDGGGVVHQRFIFYSPKKSQLQNLSTQNNHNFL